MFNAGTAAKRRGLSATEMAAAVDEGLTRHGWFVTGKVDASIFSDDFFFEDPQVGLTQSPSSAMLVLPIRGDGLCVGLIHAHYGFAIVSFFFFLVCVFVLTYWHLRSKMTFTFPSDMKFSAAKVALHLTTPLQY